MFDITTIMKAIQLVGAATPAGKAIYDGFVFLLSGATQDELKARYAAERKRSDEAHEAAQQALGGKGA